jgi:hypothetical protein
MTDILRLKVESALLEGEALPDDVQNWLRDVDLFVVVIENDGLILKKAHSRRTLEEMVTKEKAPLSDEKLNELIHESRK